MESSLLYLQELFRDYCNPKLSLQKLAYTIPHMYCIYMYSTVKKILTTLFTMSQYNRRVLVLVSIDWQ